ncbi:MAG: O-antigen ligase family protein [Planctomycetota bacterium]
MLVLLGWTAANPRRFLDGLIVAGVLAVAVRFAKRSPSALVPLFIVTFTFNRELRRVLDWGMGQFSQTPITSLLPPLLSLMLGVVALAGARKMPAFVRQAVFLVVAALAYGFVVGLGNRVGAMFELVAWSTPIGLMLFVLWLRPSVEQVRSWIKVLILCAVVAAVYGWVQFVVYPPWDKFWVDRANMSSLGKSQALSVRMFGTMADPGSLGILIVLGVLPLLAVRHWRSLVPGPSSLAVIAFLVTTLLATRARTTWLMLLTGLALFALLGRARDSGRMLLMACLAGAAIFFAMPFLPNQEGITERVATLGDVQNDGSFRGRVHFTTVMLGHIATNPVGWGFGSAGLAGRVGETSTQITAFDNGFLQFPFTFGWLGAAVFLAALLILLGRAWRARRLPGEAGDVQRLGLCIVLSFILSLATSNFFDNAHAAFFWLMLGLLLAWSVRPPVEVAVRSLPMHPPPLDRAQS